VPEAIVAPAAPAAPVEVAVPAILPVVESNLPDGRPYKLHVPVSGHIDDAYLQAMRTGGYKDSTWMFFVTWLRAGDVFFDLGSSLGAYSIPAATLGANVHSFELIQANAIQLAGSVAENRLTNISINLGAVWDRLGSVGFIEGHSAWAMVAEENYMSIATTVIDEYVKQKQIARVDVMKIDIEGSERAALKGAAQLLERDHPDIVIESNVFTCGKSGYSYREPLAFLAERGYGIYRFVGNRLAPCTADDVQEVIVVDYFASVKSPEEISARSGWTVAPLSDQEMIASVLEQGNYSERHITQVLAVEARLPAAVRENAQVAEALLRWRSNVDPQLLKLLEIGSN